MMFPSVLSRIGFGIPSTARPFAFNTRSGGVRPGWVRRSRPEEWTKAVGDDQPLQGQVEQDGYLQGGRWVRAPSHRSRTLILRRNIIVY